MSSHHHSTFAQDWMEAGRLVHGEYDDQFGVVTVHDADTSETLRQFTCASEADLVHYALLQRHAEEPE